jgi:hypothetical protein
MPQPLGKQPGKSFVPWTDLDSALDPPIFPLVTALNATRWARTVFSCGGHPEEVDSVKAGRRQAHVDLVVSDLGRWNSFVSAVKRAKPKAVRAVEGNLGPVPAWLADALQAGAASDRWRYRRLVFEPAPYSMPPDECRAVLDAALAAALSVLAEAEG